MEGILRKRKRFLLAYKYHLHNKNKNKTKGLLREVVYFLSSINILNHYHFILAPLIQNDENVKR